jgi:hypothetical protein
LLLILTRFAPANPNSMENVEAAARRCLTRLRRELGRRGLAASTPVPVARCGRDEVESHSLDQAFADLVDTAGRPKLPTPAFPGIDAYGLNLHLFPPAGANLSGALRVEQHPLPAPPAPPHGSVGQPYLKDWHCLAALAAAQSSGAHGDTESQQPPALYHAPPGLLYDWLNVYCDGRQRGHGDDDFFFLYAGGAGSWTPLHCDVVGSFSWSTNVAGQYVADGAERCEIASGA